MQVNLSKGCALQEVYSGFFTGFHRLFIPQTGLYFPDVNTAKDQHAEAGLSDAASDRER